MALPTITMSGRGFMLASEYGFKIGMAIEARKSDIGGYAAASEPVTLNPRCFSRPASDAMAVPQIPIRCTCCWSTVQVNGYLSRLPISSVALLKSRPQVRPQRLKEE